MGAGEGAGTLISSGKDGDREFQDPFLVGFSSPRPISNRLQICGGFGGMAALVLSNVNESLSWGVTMEGGKPSLIGGIRA